MISENTLRLLDKSLIKNCDSISKSFIERLSLICVSCDNLIMKNANKNISGFNDYKSGFTLKCECKNFEIDFSKDLKFIKFVIFNQKLEINLHFYSRHLLSIKDGISETLSSIYLSSYDDEGYEKDFEKIQLSNIILNLNMQDVWSQVENYLMLK